MHHTTPASQGAHSPSSQPLVSPFANAMARRRSSSVMDEEMALQLAPGSLAPTATVSPSPSGTVTPSPIGTPCDTTEAWLASSMDAGVAEPSARDARRASRGSLDAPGGFARLRDSLEHHREAAGNHPPPRRHTPRASLESTFARAAAIGSGSLSAMSRASSGDRPAPSAPQETSLTAGEQDLSDLRTIRRTIANPRPVLSRQSAFSRLTSDMRQASRQPASRGASLRSTSVPAVRRTTQSAEFAFAHLSDATRRNAFGMGRGWDVLEEVGPDNVDSVFRNLAVWAENTEPDQSFIPIMKMGPTIAGKMSVAIGADLLTLGLSRKEAALIGAGAACIGVGIVVVMMGMQALMFDMRRINPKRIPITLIFSFLGMVLVSGTLVLSETDLGSQNLGVRTVSAIFFGVGLTLLNTSLPLSFAYSEMIHGDTFRSYRNEAAFLLWGIGLGLATGLTVSRGAPHDKVIPKIYPFGVGHAFAVLGIACATLGTCLVATNLQRQVGLLLGLRTRVRQLATEARGDDAV